MVFEPLVLPCSLLLSLSLFVSVDKENFWETIPGPCCCYLLHLVSPCLQTIIVQWIFLKSAGFGCRTICTSQPSWRHDRLSGSASLLGQLPTECLELHANQFFGTRQYRNAHVHPAVSLTYPGLGYREFQRKIQGRNNIPPTRTSSSLAARSRSPQLHERS